VCVFAGVLVPGRGRQAEAPGLDRRVATASEAG